MAKSLMEKIPSHCLTFSLRQLMAVIVGVAILFSCAQWAAKIGASWWVLGAFQCSMYFYPRFGCAAGAALLVAMIVAGSDRRVWRFRSLWLLLPIAVPMALLVFGIVFRNNGPATVATAQNESIVTAFPWLQLPIGLVLMGCFRSVSNWIIVVCISLMTLWLSFGAQIMSGMSVSNIWL